MTTQWPSKVVSLRQRLWRKAGVTVMPNGKWDGWAVVDLSTGAFLGKRRTLHEATELCDRMAREIVEDLRRSGPSGGAA